MNMKKLIFISTVILCMGAMIKLSAQTATPRITEKQVTQQARIQEGKRSGELTPKETARVQMRQAKVQHDKRVAKSDGVVTPAERRKLRAEQRRANRAIYRQKHNSQKR